MFDTMVVSLPVFGRISCQRESFQVLSSSLKMSFFKSLNAIFSKVGRFASEEVVLNLLRVKCLPVLLYGVESCPLLVRDKRSLEFTVTRSFMKSFRTGSAAIVDECHFFSFLPSYMRDRYPYGEISTKIYD